MTGYTLIWVSIPTGSSLIAIATLIGAAVGAGIQVAWRIRKLKRKRENLRRTIWAEMMTLRPYLAGEFGPEGQFLRKTIYENNADELGLLTSEEAEAIVQFYGHAITLQNAINQAGGDQIDRNQTFIEGNMRANLDVWFDHAVEQLYPYVDVDDELEEIKVAEDPPPYA